MPWMIKIISGLSVLNSAIIGLFKYLALSAVAIMTFVILLQVFFRYVLNNSFPWSEELARYLMVWMTFLTLPVVSRLKQHAALEIILGSLPHKLNTILQLIIYGLTGIVLFIAFDKSYDFAMKGTRMLATALPVTKAWSYTAMPVGFFVMMLVYLELFLINLVDLFSPEKAASLSVESSANKQ
ncbi:TRAP transporter small permease [Marinomonas sp. 15G1-11]|uniref:TRAP transporter small permease protein n=1 Tax=Marinomonas phaeophyticola TaxID=3004091 RepID=A0ABT4JU69_9GAMM|nr:TRAP transporter small permease [Marinomonas sp. 15G1-11]MCZ2721929.1 TRAP transporter small permease [Marinomonas sp. 15G1-11]